MSEIAKVLAATGLLSAGFFGASLFGPPPGAETGDTGSNAEPAQRLVPLSGTPAISANSPEMTTFAGDASVAPAGHWEENAASQPIEHQVVRPSLPDVSLIDSAPQSFEFPSISRTPAPVEPAGTPSVAAETRLAELMPPPLLDSNLQASPLRRATFPTQPTAPAPATNYPSTDVGLVANSSSNSTPWGNLPSATGPAATTDWGAPALSTFNTSTTAEPVWHVVHDGDSLAKLAARYLGDAQRAREIYELNRDVIDHPDLLKIGAKLRIPQNVARQTAIEVYDANGASAGTFAPQSRLVPLPELPSNLQGVPRAHLQPPVSASLAVGS